MLSLSFPLVLGLQMLGYLMVSFNTVSSSSSFFFFFHFFYFSDQVISSFVLFLNLPSQMCSIILKIKAFVLFNSKICLILKITSISFFIVYFVRHHSHAFFKHVFNYLDLKFLFSKSNIFRDSIY